MAVTIGGAYVAKVGTVLLMFHGILLSGITGMLGERVGIRAEMKL